MSVAVNPIARAITKPVVSALLTLVALAGAVALIVGLGQASREAGPLDQLPRGFDSTQAAALAERLPQQGSSAIVLFTREGGLTPADLQLINQRLAGLPTTPGAPPLIPSQDGTATLSVIEVAATDASGAADEVAALRSKVKADLPAGLTAQVTGAAAVQADLAAVFDGANLRLLIATASVVALLLIATYRSPLLFMVPLVVVGLADQVAAVAATHLLKLTGVVWDESTVGILSVLVFGAGTDYALLLISRYRDELRLTADRRVAMAIAVSRTTEAVVASALTVVVGLLTLLLSVFPATRGLGLACAIGVLVAALFALVVLPATLVNFGRWIFWPRRPEVGQQVLVESHSGWRRIGDRVAAHPARFVVVSLAALVAASGITTQITTGLSDADQFLKKPEAIAAFERLAQSFPAGSANPTTVITTADPTTVVGVVSAVDGVESVRPGATADGVSEVSVVLSAAPDSEQAKATIARIRTAVADLPQSHVGGAEAQSVDEAAATSQDRGLILPLILALVVVALGGLLRSVVAPVILVASVVLTYLASLGLAWVLFTQLLGFARLDSGTPLLAFVFLVALGVDYNIFLVTRAREEARQHGSREGMLRALAATGGVITSAGILLAAVFAVLGVLPLVVLAQLGVIICIGVLLDTLLVRTVVVPAIALLLGDRFWWPRRPVRPARRVAPSA